MSRGKAHEFYTQERVVEEDRENESSSKSRGEFSKSGSIVKDDCLDENKHSTGRKDAGESRPRESSEKSSGENECFDFEEGKTDEVREKFEIIGIKMDVHKNGTLYLKEISSMLEELPAYQRGPVSDFLVAYMKQTKKIVTTLPVFISNIVRAYNGGKFGLRHVLSAPENGDELNEAEIAQLERVAKTRPAPKTAAAAVHGRLGEGRMFKTEDKRRPARTVKPAKASVTGSPSKGRRPPPKTAAAGARKVLTAKGNIKGKEPAQPPPQPQKEKKPAAVQKKKLPVQESPSGKYAKLAQRKLVAKAAPKSSYERPTQAFMLRHRLNQFLSKKQSIGTEHQDQPQQQPPAKAERESSNNEDSAVSISKPSIHEPPKTVEPPSPPLPPPPEPQQPAANPPKIVIPAKAMLPVDDMPPVAPPVTVPSPEDISPINGDPNSPPDIDPKHTLALIPPRRERFQQPQQKQRLNNDPFGRSDSISEDAEFQYDDADTPIKGTKGAPSEFMSSSCSFINCRGEEQNSLVQHKKKLSRASSYDAGPMLDEERKGSASPFLSRNEKCGGKADLSDNNLIAAGKDSEIEFNIGERERSKDFDSANLQVMTLGDLQDLNQMVHSKDPKHARHNIYDIKSQKKLQCVLRNGYSYKFHEKKHYKAEQKQVAHPEQLTKPELTLLTALKMGSQSPRMGCNESAVRRQESSSSLDSTRQFYNEVFADRAGNEAKALQQQAAEPSIELCVNVGLPMPSVEVKLNTVKKNRMYKDLNIDLGLRDIFADFNYKQLMEIKKLHLLYAHQRGKLKQDMMSRRKLGPA